MGILKKSAGTRSRPFNKASKAGVGGLALVFGFLLYMLFRPGGTGGGTSATSENPDSEDSRPALVSGTAVIPGAATAQTSDRPDSSDLPDEDQHALKDNVLTVLIYEHSFLVRVSPGDEPVYRPVELGRVVELALRATGDSNGIRVRIIRRESARAAAEENLKQSLKRSGIGSDALHMSEQFVP